MCRLTVFITPIIATVGIGRRVFTEFSYNEPGKRDEAIGNQVVMTQ